MEIPENLYLGKSKNVTEMAHQMFCAIAHQLEGKEEQYASGYVLGYISGLKSCANICDINKSKGVDIIKIIGEVADTMIKTLRFCDADERMN